MEHMSLTFSIVYFSSWISWARSLAFPLTQFSKLHPACFIILFSVYLPLSELILWFICFLRLFFVWILSSLGLPMKLIIFSTIMVSSMAPYLILMVHFSVSNYLLSVLIIYYLLYFSWEWRVSFCLFLPLPPFQPPFPSICKPIVHAIYFLLFSWPLLISRLFHRVCATLAFHLLSTSFSADLVYSNLSSGAKDVFRCWQTKTFFEQVTISPCCQLQCFSKDDCCAGFCFIQIERNSYQVVRVLEILR